MKRSYTPNLYVALIHFPVVNKHGDVIASAVTNLDLHDIARAAKTYGVKAFYIVTPLEDQKALVEKIVDHWVRGAGARYNPKRRQALELIRIRKTLDEVVEEIEGRGDGCPKIVATCARGHDRGISYGSLRSLMGNGKPFLLTLGTAWGLAQAFVDGADLVLEPVCGGTDYNHLSVRSAASIILDRLIGEYT